MPNPRPRWATRLPIFPTPMMPSVSPRSSPIPRTRCPRHSPLRVARSMGIRCLIVQSMSMRACSATESEFEPGACTTAMPRRVAAGRSTVSSPTP